MAKPWIAPTRRKPLKFTIAVPGFKPIAKIALTRSEARSMAKKELQLARLPMGTAIQANPIRS